MTGRPLVILMTMIAVTGYLGLAIWGAGEREDRSNRWVIAVFGVLGLLLGYVPARTDRPRHAGLFADEEV